MNIKEITVEAKIENMEKVTAFVDEMLEELDCPLKAQTQLDIAIDELASNIVNYAYEGGQGDMTIGAGLDEDTGMFRIVFKDRGMQYDPLKKEDPDITKPLEEREIGGLGIFMVKKTMDDITYEYKDGVNILTIYKKIR